MSSIEIGKKAAAVAAVNDWLKVKFVSIKKI